MAKEKKDKKPEFVPEIDKKERVEQGTCDNCKYARYHIHTANENKGLCEIGRLLRGTTEIPPENTCNHWESNGSLAKV